MAEEQEILDAPEIGEEQQDGPGPKPVLSEERRSKLDSIVNQMIQNKEPEENIRKVVSDFKSKYAVTIPELPKGIPAQKPVSESTSRPATPTPKIIPGLTTEEQLKKKQADAKNTLRDALTQNDDLIPQKIKKDKSQAAAAQRLTEFSQAPRSDQPLTNAQRQMQALAPAPPPVEVTPEDVSAFKDNIQNNADAARGFLHHVSDKKPDQAKKIQAALYLHDASERVDQNPGKAAQVYQNAQKIEKGQLTYNIQGGHLQKPEDAWESISTGLKAKNQAFADYDLFSNATPQQATQELEKRRNAYDPDEATPIPANFASSLTGGMASQPLKGLVAGKVTGGATALIPGAEEFAPAVDKFTSAAVSGNDYRKMTYATALQRYYNELRNQGNSPEEAYQKANGQAKDEAMVDAVAGAAMVYAGGRIGEMKLPAFNLSNGYKAALTTALKQGAQGIGEAGAVGLIQGAAQDAKNKLADMKGIRHDESGKDIGEAMESGGLFTLGIAALTKGMGALTAKAKTQLAGYLAKAEPIDIQKELGHQILEGHITPDEAKQTEDLLNQQRVIDASIPDNISDESRLKIQNKIERRQELEKQLETADKAYHPEIKEKIKAVNEDILELSKDKKPNEQKDETLVENENVPRETSSDENQRIEENVPRHDIIQPDANFRTLNYGENEGKPESKEAQNKINEEIVNNEPIGKTGDKFSDFLGRIIPSFQKMMDSEEHNTVLVTHSSVKKALRVWEAMGRPSVDELTGDKLKEFAGKYISETKEPEGKVDSFKGDNGNEIKVVRHGETEDNKLSEFRDNATQLTDKGVGQAKKAGQNLKQQTGGNFPKIVTSDLPRTIHTSNIIADELGSKMSIQAGDMVVSPHFEGPQQVRSVSENGQSVYIEGPDHHVHEVPINDITLKVKSHASTIRGDTRQVQEGGNATEGGQETRSNDLQQPSEETPVNAETKQQAGEVGSVPPEMFDLPFEPEPADVTRLAHADTEKLYEELGSAGRVPRATKTDIELEKQADELIAKGYDFVKKAHEVLNGDAHFTDAEQVAFSKMVGALKAKLNHLDIDSPEFDAIEDKIELLSRASDIVGSEEGAAFRARRLFVLNDQTLSDYIQQDKESLGVDELTSEQKAKNKEEFDNINGKQKEYEDKIAALEEENAKLKAEKSIPKSKKGAKKSHEEYVKDRKSILEEMRADLLKVAKGQGGLTASVPGVAQLTAIAPHVAKLVRSLAEEGYTKLEDIVKNIHGDLKDVVEGITEKDVRDLIAGKYNEKKATKNELSARLRDLKDEANLINKLEALQNGEEPKSEKKKVERNKQITDLRKQIADIQKAKAKEDKEANTFYTEPKSIDRQKLDAIKKANEKELNKIHTQLKAEDFEEPEKNVPWYENKELKERLPKAFEDAKVARDLLLKAKSEREVRILKQQYANRSKIQKTLDFVAEVGNTPRSIMSSLDFSAPLRQGIWGVTKQLYAHPRDLGRQFSFMFKAARSQRVFDRWFADLKEAPDYEVIQKSGLPIADPHDPKLTVKEEAFMSNLAEKIPIIGKAIKGSENAYVGFLNKMRVDMFRRGTDGFLANGKTFENSPELYKAFADYVGAGTGRGKMPDILEKSAPILNSMFFSPRLIASRLNLLTNWANPKFYAKVPKEVRVQYFKDMAKFIGTGLVVLSLAKAGGAEVEDDPRSADFGKIKSGNTRWDIWGGFQQYVRLAGQLITGQKKSTTSGNIMELNGQYPSRQTRLDALISFGRAKLAPLPGETADLLAGKDVTGKPVTLGSEALKNVPLVLNDITEAAQDQGVKGALMVGIPSMFGVGVQTYKPNNGGGSGGGGGASNTYEIKQWK